MKKRPLKISSRVSEPLQIYISPDERHLLDSLSSETGLSRAEILRRGLKSYAAEQAGEDGPMQALVVSLRTARWTPDIATAHDDHLAKAYADRHTR